MTEKINELQRAAELMTTALLRDLGDEVDLIVQFGSLLKGNTHKYSDLDLAYIPVHEGTWDHITVLVNDTLIDLFPIHWSHWTSLAEFDHPNCTILLHNQILYARSDAARERFHSLQEKFQTLLQPSARPQMVRKAQKIFQDAAYPYYLLRQAAVANHTLAAMQQTQSILQSMLHCLAVLNQAAVDTRKLNQVLALALLPQNFALILDQLLDAADPAAFLTAAETLMKGIRDLLLAVQGQVLRRETSFAELFNGAYPELKNDLQHLLLACERRDKFNFNFISFTHEFMIHTAIALSGIEYSGFNSIREYEQDLAAWGFPDLLPAALARDYDTLHEQCLVFDRRLRQFLSERDVALNEFASLEELDQFLQG